MEEASVTSHLPAPVCRYSPSAVLPTPEGASEKSGKSVSGDPAQPVASERLGVGCGGSADRTGSTRLVNLENPTHPTLAGQLTGNFGNWLATAPSGVIVGTSSTASGINTAGLGTLAIVRDVSPVVVTVDDDGKTTEPITVTYQLLAPPPDVTQGTMHLDEVPLLPGSSQQANAVGTYPLPDLTDGVHSVTIPAGVPLTIAPEEVEIDINLPGREPMSPIRAFVTGEIDEDASGSTASGGLASPVFDSISPAYVALGVGDTAVTIAGTNLSSVTAVHILGLDGQWHQVDTTTRTATSLQLTIPAALLATAGFMQVAPIEDPNAAVAFLIVAPGLPALGSAADIQPGMVEPDDLQQASGTVSVIGAGFTDGMSLIIGRGATPGLALPTTLVSDDVLEATLPSHFLGKADDLLVAVLSSDGQRMSAPLPLVSSSPDAITELIQVYQDAADNGAPKPPFVTGVFGEILWNVLDQKIDIEGLGLTSGIEVLFKTAAGVFAAQTQPSATAASVSGLTRLSAIVPSQVVSQAAPSFWLTLQRGIGQTIESGRAWLWPQPDIKIPLGGRVRFAAYSDLQGKNVFMLPETSRTQPRVRFLRPNLQQRVVRMPGTFTIVNNPQQDSGLTMVREERESTDPNGFYLRGTGLSGFFSKPKVNVAWAGLSRTVAVKVVKGKLGTRYPEHDDEINDTADTYGVPPQYLKAQAMTESNRFQANFRYEFMTRDWAWMTGDAPQYATNSSSGNRWLDEEPFRSYALNGTRLAAPTPFHDQRQIQCTQNPDCGRVFNVGVPMMRAAGYPPEKADLSVAAVRRPRVTAAINGNPLVAVSGYAIWRKHGSQAQHPNGEVETAHPIAAGQFSVDYATGTVTLGEGAPLMPGDTLTIGFDPVAAANQEPINGTGEFTYDLNKVDSHGNRVVKQYPFDLVYSAGQSLADFLAANAAACPRGNWLTTSGTGERHIEFTVTNGNQPARPLDQRYAGMTAQPSVSSSYGTLQLMFDQWSLGAHQQESGAAARIAKMSEVLDVTKTPIFQALDDWKTGLALGAVLHQARLKAAMTPPSSICGPCSADQWKGVWEAIIRSYNPNGSGYRETPDPQIILDGQNYEPRLP